MQEYSKCFLKNSKNGLALPDNKTCNKMVVSKAETGRQEENIYIYLNDVSWKDLTKKVNSV